MSSDLVDEITKKVSTLPVEAQQKALVYIERLQIEKAAEVNTRKPFRSVLGIFADRNVHVSEEDITEIRREAWRSFPREEPK